MSKIITKNRKAYFEYAIIEEFVAGIQLVGSEVKSIRDNKVSITEGYCYIHNGEIFVKSMYINEYQQGGKHFNHDPHRDKKLLLNKKEITKLSDKSSQKGYSIIPLNVFLSDTGFIKVTVGLGKGKKLYDKKDAIKERDLKIEMNRNI